MEAELCHCGRRVLMKTSWSDRNPGRRYSACEKFKQIGGCNYFIWLDPEMCARSKQIIPGLLRRLNNMEAEVEKRKNREKWLLVAVVFCFLFFYLFK